LDRYNGHEEGDVLMSLSPINGEDTAVFPTLDTTGVAEAALHLVPEPVVPALSGDDIRHLVALHVAATLLPVGALLTTREEVRARWFDALQVVEPLPHHPEWAMAYLPGLHPCDADAYVVHLPTEYVFGGDATTSIHAGESTDGWLDRLATLLPHA
jgi:hypothetical protein